MARETTVVAAPVAVPDGVRDVVTQGPAVSGQPEIQSVEDHAAQAEEQLTKLRLELLRRTDLPVLRIPLLKMSAVKSELSLADIIDHNAFRNLGEAIAADPVGQLRRMTLGARIVEGSDGLRRTELVPERALDRIESPASLFPLDELRSQLVDHILMASVVPARPNQRRPAGEIVDAFVRGLGVQADKILSGYMDRAAGGLIQLITEEHRRFATRPSYQEVVGIAEFDRVRLGRPESSGDSYSAFRKGVGYEGYRKSLYAQDWFDSSPERDVANILEDEEETSHWVRLQVGDLPILWTGAKEYNPDFISMDKQGTHWVIEVKMDREITSGDVQGKRDAALRWANHVSADDKIAPVTWRYLLLSEADVKTARGSWGALRKLGGY